MSSNVSEYPLLGPSLFVAARRTSGTLGQGVGLAHHTRNRTARRRPPVEPDVIKVCVAPPRAGFEWRAVAGVAARRRVSRAWTSTPCQSGPPANSWEVPPCALLEFSRAPHTRVPLGFKRAGISRESEGSLRRRTGGHAKGGRSRVEGVPKLSHGSKNVRCLPVGSRIPEQMTDAKDAVFSPSYFMAILSPPRELRSHVSLEVSDARIPSSVAGRDQQSAAGT